jgi:hypothetical protein
MPMLRSIAQGSVNAWSQQAPEYMITTSITSYDIIVLENTH